MQLKRFLNENLKPMIDLKHYLSYSLSQNNKFSFNLVLFFFLAVNNKLKCFIISFNFFFQVYFYQQKKLCVNCNM